MATFMTAYVIAWLAVFFYLVRLAARQRRLEQLFETRQFDRAERLSAQSPARAEAHHRR